MRFGMCLGIGEPERVSVVKNAGYDYIECGFAGLSQESDEIFDAFAAALSENGIRCEAANGFFPGNFKLLGPEKDEALLRAYVEKGMERGSRIGLKTVVLGSGRARDIPEGMDFKTAFNEIAATIRDVAAPIAEKYDIDIAVEPLRAAESTIIHTVTEGVMLAAAAGRANVYGLADLYHMAGSGDTADDVRALAGCIRHSHIANPGERDGKVRMFPCEADEYDYRSFLAALTEAGCTRCSVEGRCDDFDTECVRAIRALKACV